MEREVYNAHFEHDENHWWFRGRRAVVEELLAQLFPRPLCGNHLLNKKQDSVLDVGAGAGGMIPLLQDYGIVHALEMDHEAAERLRTRYKGEVEVFECMLHEARQSGRYSIVSLFDVLEHIDDDTRAVREINRLLEPGGSVVLTVPAFQFLWSAHDVTAHHKRRYTKKTLVNLLRTNGFEITKVTYFNTFLFPLIAAVRLVEKLIPQKETNFTKGAHGALNTVLENIFSAERFVLRIFSFPFGVSLFCVAKKITVEVPSGAPSSREAVPVV